MLLVVEVSDESVFCDLNVKARLYGRAGFGVYWVVTQDAIYEHTEPSSDGYRNRHEYRRGDRIPIRTPTLTSPSGTSSGTPQRNRAREQACRGYCGTGPGPVGVQRLATGTARTVAP